MDRLQNNGDTRSCIDGNNNNCPEVILNVQQQQNNGKESISISKKISIAWNNLRYEEPAPRQHDHIGYFLQKINLLQPPGNRVRQNVQTDSKPEPIIVLRRLTGHFQFNTVNAILEPCAKKNARSALIRCLTGTIQMVDNRHRFGQISQDSGIYLNDCENRHPAEVAWIPADLTSAILPQMTVGEILRYAFLFKNGLRHLGRISSHIHHILALLMLDYGTVIRKKFEHCSPGEQRRLAIAQQFMSMTPAPFVVLDQPFERLDFISMHTVLDSLRQLSRHYNLTTIVLATSPATHLIPKFDKLYILAHGGVCIFSGPPAMLGPTLKQELNMIINEERKPPVEEYFKFACHELSNAKVRKLAEHTLAEEHQAVQQHLDQLRFIPEGVSHRCHLITFFSPIHLVLNMFRFARILIFNRISLYRLVATILFHLFLSVMMDHRMIQVNGCYDPRLQFLNRTCVEDLREDFLADSYLAYQMYATAFMGSMAMICTGIFFGRLLTVFQNEYQNQWYSMTVFYFSSLMIHFLDAILWTSLSTVLMFYMVDHTVIDLHQAYHPWLPSPIRFGHFLLFYFILYLYYQSYGFLIGAIWRRNNLLIIISSLVIVLVSQILNNNILVIVELMHLPIVAKISNKFVPIRFLYDGIAYTFYALGRCDRHNQRPFSSIILERYLIEFDDEFQIYWNLFPVFINILVIRAIVFIVMCYTIWWRLSFRSGNRRKKQNRPPTDMIPIDYGHLELHPIRKKAKVRILPPVIKDDDEVEFSRDKIHLAWRSLSLFGNSSRSKKRPNLILRNLNGQFRLGTMNAVIGGRSHSTRTMLLEVFSGRLKNRLSPESKLYESKYFGTMVCFISRYAHEHLTPGLTAKQSLIYASAIKNIEEDFEGTMDHEELALNILDELDLGHLSKTFVEDCSVSEQKRLALALELTSLQMPNIICLDDPIGGLDCRSEEMVIGHIRHLVDRHSLTVIATMSEPLNHEVLNMFDQVYCLGQDGVCIYSGPVNGIRQHLSTATSISDQEECYPLDELMRYSCMPMETEPTVAKLIRLSDSAVSEADKQLPEDTILVSPSDKPETAHFSVPAVKRLLRRYRGRWKYSLWFDWTMYLAVYIGVGLLLTALFGYFDLSEHNGCTRLDIFNLTTCPFSQRLSTESDLLWNGYRYAHLSNHLFMLVVMLQSASIFQHELRVFRNEHRNGWYSTGAFYITKAFMDFVPMLPVILIYVYIVDISDYKYRNLHLDSAPSTEPLTLESSSSLYWWMVIAMLMATKSFQSISHLVVIITLGHRPAYRSGKPSPAVMLAVLGTFFFMFITSNFLITPSFPAVINRFLACLNVLRTLDECMVLLQYNRCGAKQISLILHRMSITEDRFGQSLRALIIQAFVYWILAWWALLIRINSDRIFYHHRSWKYGDEMAMMPIREDNVPDPSDTPTSDTSTNTTNTTTSAASPTSSSSSNHCTSVS